MTEKLTAMQQLHNFPNDLHMSVNARLGKAMNCDKLLLCGMGGSSISNVIVYNCIYTKSKFIHILRTPIFPQWADDKTLAVISSYSGNTVETIEMYREAMKHHCKIVIITSGGKLKELAEENDHIVYSLPNGMDPRHSIGYMIGFIFAINRDVGGYDATETVSSLDSELQKYVKSLERKTPNKARNIADKLVNKTTIVYYSKEVESVASRWKSQITENAKDISILEPLEFFDDKKETGFDKETAVLVFTTDDSKIKTLKKKYSKKKYYFNYFIIDENNFIESVMKTIILGDFVSIYMAEIKGVESRNVEPITKLKEKMKRKL